MAREQEKSPTHVSLLTTSPLKSVPQAPNGPPAISPRPPKAAGTRPPALKKYRKLGGPIMLTKLDKDMANQAINQHRRFFPLGYVHRPSSRAIHPSRPEVSHVSGDLRLHRVRTRPVHQLGGEENDAIPDKKSASPRRTKPIQTKPE